MLGETIGHFKIVSRLGAGGMGAVYAGEHEGIQTRVAIKVLHPEVSRDTAHVQRFFNEAKIVGRIKHAGIVKIFDVGFYKDHAYLVMELLEGEPLSARIERVGRLTWKEAADLARQIANVLDATHRAGIVHRDLKPDNIFLTPDHELAGGERVKILDFGISKLTGATLSGGSPKTVGTMGTPQYMAPEQWGDAGQVDWRADAYSLGCVIFELATGRPPFVVTSIADACAKHLHAAPPAASSLIELPPALDELILRLLAKDASDRAISMAQVAHELEAIGKGQHVVAPAALPPRRTGPAGKMTTTLGASAAEIGLPRRPNRTPLVIGGVAAVAVFGALLVVKPSGSRTPPDPPAHSPPPPPAVAMPVAAPPIDLPPPPDAAPPPPDASPIDAPVIHRKHHAPQPPPPLSGDEFGGRH